MKEVMETILFMGKLENKAENDLTRIFVLVATIIIPLSTPVFFNENIFSTMKLFQKITFSLGWFLMVASLTLGLIFFVIVHNYFRSTRVTMEHLHQDVDSNNNMSDAEKYSSLAKEIKKITIESKIWPMRLQIICLFLGLFLFALNIVWSIF